MEMTIHYLHTLKRDLEKADDKWTQEFLEENGLEAIEYAAFDFENGIRQVYFHQNRNHGKHLL